MGSTGGFTRGDIEKNLIKKGMTKAQAAKQMEANGGSYMNNTELLQARQRENDRLKERREKFDL